MSLLHRMVVYAWMASMTTHVNVSENTPENSVIFLQVSHSCTRKLHLVSITSVKMEYAINQMVLQMIIYVNVLQGTQVYIYHQNT